MQGDCSIRNTIAKLFSAVLNEILCKWIERVEVLGDKQNRFHVTRRIGNNKFVVNEMIKRKKDGQNN